MLGHYELRRIIGAPDGSPALAIEIPSASRLRFSATLADGTHPDVAYDDTSGAFSFVLAEPGQSYRLQRLLDGNVEELQLAAPTLHVVDSAAGRADATTATVPTPVTFDLGIEVPSTVTIVSTGVFDTVSLGGVTPATVDWNVAQGGVKPALVDASKGDVLYSVRFTDSSSTPTYSALTSFRRDAITLVNGMPATVHGPLATIPPICATITANRADEDARMLAQVPDTYEPYFGDWRVFAIPEPAIGAAVTLSLAASGETGTATNVVEAASFIDPFPGTSIVASIGTSHQRDLAIAGANATTVPFGIRYFVPVDNTSDCAANQVVASAALGFAKVPTLAGQLLDHDLALSLGTGDTLLTWPTDLPVDLTVVTIEQVGVAGGNTTLTPVMHYLTPTTQLAISRGTLVTGQSYIIRFDTTLGTPNAKDGDFATVLFPTGNATTWSHVFEVQ